MTPEAPHEVVGSIAPTPLLIVHGDADHYFPMRHVDLLAAAAQAAQLWVEEGMGHAETATSPDLVDRIDPWGAVARSFNPREKIVDGDIHSPSPTHR